MKKILESVAASVVAYMAIFTLVILAGNAVLKLFGIV